MVQKYMKFTIELVFIIELNPMLPHKTISCYFVYNLCLFWGEKSFRLFNLIFKALRFSKFDIS